MRIFLKFHPDEQFSEGNTMRAVGMGYLLCMKAQIDLRYIISLLARGKRGFKTGIPGGRCMGAVEARKERAPGPAPLSAGCPLAPNVLRC